MIYREKRSKLKDHPFSIAEGRTKLHRFLRFTLMNIAFAIDGVLLAIVINVIPSMFGVDIDAPVMKMENKWFVVGLIALIGVGFVFFMYYSLRACDWLCKKLRI
ncbi:hypothetical protein L6J37_18600 [Photobacterium sp. WH77]|uniref:hypothetical protein n=1 Tax=unclassified Photobacterium TaxID=2628852 RepID=UPI001EDAA090|nr:MULTISPECIES: hypothetical protein [unclassified Photobacterium]MCG2838849.1 hypothetical protein [Photobacterium sp. WH77]MCG2846466.1 hypothetical protein [Photobacterium sp. WH80]